MIRTGLGIALVLAAVLPAHAEGERDCFRGPATTEASRNRRQVCLAIKAHSDLPCSFIQGDRVTRLTCVAIATKNEAACSTIQDDARRDACLGYARTEP